MPKAFLTTILCAFAISACATPPGGDTVHLRGKINSAMVEKAERAVEAGHRQFTIESDGGFLIASMALGSVLKNSGSTLTARGRCLSGCALVLVAVSERYAEDGTAVAFHDAGTAEGNRLQAMWLARHGVSSDAAVGRYNFKPLSVADLARLGVR
jgi:hypothetical protein